MLLPANLLYLPSQADLYTKSGQLGMDLRELTEAMHAFVAAKGWYAAGSPRPQTARNLAASLAIEAAEVLEHFQWGQQAPTPELAGELADVALYLLQLASLSGVDLEQAILDKLRLNYARTWDPPPAASAASGGEVE